MAVWNIDLTTEDGALSAAQIGGFACFIAAVLGLIGAAAYFAAGASSGRSMIALAGASAGLAEVALFTVAGFRLRSGRGLVWGSAAAIVMAIEFAMKVALFSVIGMLINGFLLLAMINGIRGAIALRRIAATPEDVAEIFS
ncbi:MAG: hypothetical protein JWM65_2573 [Sphingomonas bacterium]|nr:hypothetical protein [Sphingomonas bacterium]